MDFFLIGPLFVILLIAATIDWRDQRIPNALTLPCFLAAPAYYAWLNGWGGFIFSAGGIGTGIGLLLIPYMMGGMGAGDAKLMGAVGGFLGPKGVLLAFLFTGIAGGIYAILLMTIHRSKFQGFFKEKKEALLSFALTKKLTQGSAEAAAERPRLCYGLAIAVGTCTYILLNTTGAIPFGQ